MRPPTKVERTFTGGLKRRLPRPGLSCTAIASHGRFWGFGDHVSRLAGSDCPSDLDPRFPLRFRLPLIAFCLRQLRFFDFILAEELLEHRVGTPRPFLKLLDIGGEFVILYQPAFVVRLEGVDGSVRDAVGVAEPLEKLARQIEGSQKCLASQ